MQVISGSGIFTRTDFEKPGAKQNWFRSPITWHSREKQTKSESWIEQSFGSGREIVGPVIWEEVSIVAETIGRRFRDKSAVSWCKWAVSFAFWICYIYSETRNPSNFEVQRIKRSIDDWERNYERSHEDTEEILLKFVHSQMKVFLQLEVFILMIVVRVLRASAKPMNCLYLSLRLKNWFTCKYFGPQLVFVLWPRTWMAAEFSTPR
jgi:hypothetical protein